MKRTLLNIIFRKYPNLGNIEGLIDLSCSELSIIAETSSLNEAKMEFNRIICEKEKNIENNNKTLNLKLEETVFYMNV